MCCNSQKEKEKKNGIGKYQVLIQAGLILHYKPEVCTEKGELLKRQGLWHPKKTKR